jgi:hypothetical protein
MSEALEARIAALESQLFERDKANEALVARVRELEDVRQIMDLQRQWDNLCTGGFNGLETHRTKQALALMTEDATLEFQPSHDHGSGPTGVVELRRHFEPLNGMLAHACQITSDNRIEVRGDVAYQNADCIGIVEGEATGGVPSLNFCRYTMELVRTSNGWKIRKLIITMGLGTTLPEPFKVSDIRPGSGWRTEEWFGFAGTSANA